MIDLSLATREHVSALFSPTEVPGVELLLQQQCADQLPLIERSATPADLERIRFAALRVSGGKIARLQEAIRLAQTDWRDLLVAAGFADDPHAHRAWLPRRFDSELVGRWMAGNVPYGVKFELNHSVEIVTGNYKGKAGAVISLIGVEPEPRYLVELGSGEDIEEFQRALKDAG
jgi:hypothetical protein